MAKLFDPTSFGDIQLTNRIVMAPLTRNRSPRAVPNDLNVTYYEQRAAAGLIITEGTPVTQQGQGYADVPGLYLPQAIDGWKKVTDAVHGRETESSSSSSSSSSSGSSGGTVDMTKKPEKPGDERPPYDADAT